jgi:hypothetical protein
LDPPKNKYKNNNFLADANLSFNLNNVIGVIRNPFLKKPDKKNQTSDSLVRLEVLKKSVDMYSQQAKQKLVLGAKHKNFNNVTSVCNTLESQNNTERNLKIKDNAPISKDRIITIKNINLFSTLESNL